MSYLLCMLCAYMGVKLKYVYLGKEMIWLYLQLHNMDYTMSISLSTFLIISHSVNIDWNEEIKIMQFT